MSTSSIAPPHPQLDLSAMARPNPNPLGVLVNGFEGPNQQPLLASGGMWPAPHPNALRVMNEAMKLAQALILHPKGISLACEVLCYSTQPNELYPAAISHALSATTVLVLVDHWMSHTVFGKHLRRIENDVDRADSVDKNIIVVNPWHIDRLVEAELAVNDSPADYHRHLFIVADGLALELIRLLRPKVRAILRPHGVQVPPEAPPHMDGGTVEGQAFEDGLMGGRLEGVWAIGDDDELVTVDIAAATACGFDVGTFVPSLENVYKDVESTSFHCLAIAKPDGGLYPVCEDWITEVVYEFTQHGCIDPVVFPPTVQTTDLSLYDVKRLGVRNAGPSCVSHSSPARSPTMSP